MSTEVDQRVVEMRFDNRQFEAGTKETMSTLDKLREKLRFKGVEEGFENLSKASEKVDFGEMGGALDRIQMKFSALDVIAMSALNHITEKVITTGEQMVKSLSVDNIAGGWDKYVEKTGNVQTIMNATGKSVEQVNEYLSKLMWYSDETSFSFAEMTSALSQATASGGDIGKMIPMIMGIANATADAGKSGFAFQSTIRNLMQSYSAGYLQLMDWKSLNLMGTGTKALKQELISTAEELGTIKKGDVTIANFETTLSKKWATTEVMEKTFSKYSQMMTEAYNLTQQNPNMSTSEALEQLSGKYGEIAERSAKAAQQAKSFSEAISATKDAVSSKWMAVFETIIGGFDEAVETWTELSNRLYDIFVPPIEALEDRLHGALDSGWEQFRKEFGDEADTFTQTLEMVAVQSGAISQEVIDAAGGIGNAMKSGLVNAKLLQKGMKKAQTDAHAVLELSDEELASYGKTRAEVQKMVDTFDSLNEKVETGELDLENYSKKIGEMSGREHLIQSLWNLWDAIGKVVSPITEAWQEIFSPANSEQIYSFAEGLDRMTAKLIISDEAAEKIKMTAAGVFSALRVGKDILTTIATSVGKLLTLTKPIGRVLLDAASSVGVFLSGITEGLHPLEKLANATQKVVNFIASLFLKLGKNTDGLSAQLTDAIKNTFNQLDTDKLQQFVTGGLGVSMLASIKGFLSGIKSVGFSAKDSIEEIKNCVSSLGEAVKAWKDNKNAETLMTIAKAVGLMAASLTVLSMIDAERLGTSILALTVSSGGLLAVLYAISKMSHTVKSLKMSVLTAGMIGISSALLILAGALKIISTIGGNDIARSIIALGAVMGEITVVAYALSQNGKRFMKGSTGLIAFATGTLILSSAMKNLSALKWEEIGKGLSGIGGLCLEIGAFAALLNKVKFGVGKGTAIVLLAASMKLLVPVVSSFSEMKWEEIRKGLAALAGVLVEFVLALNLTKGTIGSSIALAMMAAAVNLLVPALKGLGSLSLGQIGMSLLSIGGAFAVLGVAAFILAPITPVIVALSLSLSALALSLGVLLALGSASIFIHNLASGLALLNDLDFQVFLNSIKAAAWMVVEFIAGIFEGLATVSSSLVTAVATIVKAICDAITLAAPSIANALYTLGTTVIDTVIKLIAYTWEKIEPALDDMWSNFTAWAEKHNPFDPNNWGGYSKGNATNTFALPFSDIFDELKNGDSFMAGVYQMFTKSGKYAAEGVAEGMEENGDKAENASGEMAKKSVEAFNKEAEIESPSKKMAESGMYLALGLVQGIQNGTPQVATAMRSLAEGTRKVFCDFWGIHSPSDLSMSDAENILEGIVLGIGDKERREEVYQEAYATGLLVRDATSDAMDQAITVADQKGQELVNALERARHTFDTKLSVSTGAAWRGLLTANTSKAFNDLSKYNDPAYNAIIPGKNGWTTQKDLDNGTKLDVDSGIERIKYILNKVGQTISDAGAFSIFSSLTNAGQELTENTILEQWDKIVDKVTPDLPKTSSSGKSKGSSSKNQKTAAEELADEYSKKLKSNKYLQDVADKEWSLWETKDAPDADNTAYLEKRGEALDKALDLQDKRVSIAQEQYDKMQAEASATEDQKNEALSTLLDEQKTLAELKRERYETLYEEVLDRYSDKADTADTEYDHWAAFNEKTANLTEKNDRKIKKLTDKLAIQTEASATAKRKWEEICNDLGDTSLEAEKAHREWLKAETEQQELQNELCETQLELYDNQISRYELEQKSISTRQNLMSKLYGDGEYGTVTQTINLTTAMQNMSYEMKKMGAASAKYDSYVQSNTQNTDDGIEALQALQDERYSFVGYMETFAEALDVDDDGKRMMMQLGLAVADNWTYIRDGIGKAYNRLRGMLPEAAQNLSNLWGLFQRDGMAETITSAASVFVSVIEGDYGTALASALSFALNLSNTNFGKTLIEWIGGQLGKIDWANIPGIGSIATAIGGIFSNGGILSGVGNAVSGLFSEGGIFAGIGGAVASLGMSVPQLGLIAAAIGGIGFAGYELVSHWEDVQDWFSDFGDWWSNLFQNLWKGVKGFFGGIWDGISGFFGGVVEVGSNIAGGLWEGIKGGAKFVWDGVTGFGKSLINGFKTLFGIHSPSTVMAQMGVYLGQGLAIGIRGTGKTVQESMDRVGSAALQALTDLDGSEYTPTITPVVDLSETEQKASWAQSMFATGDGSFDAQNVRTARLAAQSVKNQNGTGTTNDESNAMSEAIDRLGDRMDNITEKLSRIKLVMDSGRTVGELVSGFDSSMGKRNLLAERGVI